MERIRGILDTPEGYGVRIAYLRIEMSATEQLAFFARRDTALQDLVERNTTELRRLALQITGLQAAQRVTAETMITVASLSGAVAALPAPRMIDPPGFWGPHSGAKLEPHYGTTHPRSHPVIPSVSGVRTSPPDGRPSAR